jgi:hypothetical protein
VDGNGAWNRWLSEETMERRGEEAGRRAAVLGGPEARAPVAGRRPGLPGGPEARAPGRAKRPALPGGPRGPRS